MRRRISSLLPAILGLLFSPGFAVESEVPHGVAELEAYKQRLGQLENAENDPARSAQLRQMQRLLSLMQRSLVVKDAESKSATDVSPSSQEPAGPQPAPLPVPPPSPPAAAGTEAPPIDEPSRPPPLAPPVADAPAPAPSRESVPSGEEGIRPIPDWFFQMQMTAAVGYQENVLRSAFSSLDSTLLLGEMDFQLFNTRRDDHRLIALGRYRRTHFLDEPAVRDEDLAFLMAQADHRVTASAWVGLSASYFSAHQPFDDPDILRLETASTPLRFSQLSLAPRLTWEPAPEHRWELEGGYRDEETDGLEIEDQDNEQYFVTLRYAFEPERAHRFQWHYQYAYASYEERLSRLPSGRALEHTLELNSHECQVSYRRTWETDAFRWRFEPRIRLVVENDAHGQYDDLTRIEIRGRAGFRYRRKTELQGELRYGHYFYDQREVSLNDSRRRERSYWAGGITLEHRLTRRTSLSFSYDFREHSGNKDIDDYGVHTLYTGIRFTF